MKKFLSILVLCAVFVILPVRALSLPKKTNHEKVIINIFRGSGCSHCYEALEYFNENISKYSDYIDVNVYEVWYNEVNNSLASSVAESLGEKLDGVPYLVVGKKSFSGFSTNIGKEIIEYALKEYENNKYEDIVKNIAKSYKDAVSTTLKSACKDEGIIDGRVTIYLFRGSGCAHCHEALEYFYKNSEEFLESTYFDVKTYEVYNNSVNGELGDLVAKKLDASFDGVPFILVGNHFVNGFSDDLIKEIISYAKEEYNNDDYKDYVKETISELDTDVTESSLEEAWEEEGIIKTNDSLLIIGIFGVLFVLVGTFVILARKKNK